MMLKIIISDINECSPPEKSPCAQQCENNYGGYKCSCKFGYYISSDGKSCIGKYGVYFLFIFKN